MTQVMILDEIAELVRRFRETYTVNDHSLRVSLSDNLYEWARDEGLLNAEGDQVLVEGRWIRIDGGARDIPTQRSIEAWRVGGAKRQAPLTGPRRDAFTKRGKR